MDGEKINEFSLVEKPERLLSKYVPATIHTHLKFYTKNSRGLYLPSVTGNNFFRPYPGAKPLYLFFSVRLVDGARTLFIDDELPTGDLIKFEKRSSNKEFTHYAVRKITETITSIPCQILTLMPEIRKYKEALLIRVQLPEKPETVRWQVIFQNEIQVHVPTV